MASPQASLSGPRQGIWSGRQGTPGRGILLMNSPLVTMSCGARHHTRLFLGKEIRA